MIDAEINRWLAQLDEHLAKGARNGISATAHVRIPSGPRLVLRAGPRILAQAFGPPRVHVMRRGRSFCSMPGVPADWPKGHTWVRSDDRDLETLVTCERCLLEAKRRRAEK